MILLAVLSTPALMLLYLQPTHQYRTVKYSGLLSASGHTTDLQRHVLIQSAAGKLFLVLSSLDKPVTALLLAEANAETKSGVRKPD